MTPDPTPVLELSGIRKAYGGLRPLRLEALQLAAGRTVSLLDVEPPAVEVLMNLVTGATLPDEGVVHVFGRSTASIADGDEWLALLDRFGIVSERVVLLEEMSIAQNLAVPFTLALEPIPDAVLADVARLAAEVGFADGQLHDPVGRTGPEARARLRLGRAIALNPSLLLLEHPTAALPRDAADRLAGDLRRIAAQRGLSVLIVTADRPFAEAAGGDVLTLRPATGALARSTSWKRLFSRS
jgi:ABC-type lipoprotein export system ATPase subunit